MQQPVVEHEHGHDALAGVERGAQRRVVVDAQVAPEPDEGGRSPSCQYGNAAYAWLTVELVRDFPLFPLGLVALPSELIPLHIFEERYKAMIARCLEEESEFGIVWLADDGLRADRLRVRDRRGAGADARRADQPRRARHAGRSGSRSARTSCPIPAGTVEFLDDGDERVDPQAAAIAHSAYADLVEQATDRTPELAEIEAMTAYAMAATVEFGLDAKQGLLDLRSESARLKLVARLCRAADQAAGLHRPRAGPRALERQGQLHGLSSARDGRVLGQVARESCRRRRCARGSAPCASSSFASSRSSRCAALCSGV